MSRPKKESQTKIDNTIPEPSLEFQLAAARALRATYQAVKFKLQDDNLKILALDVKIGSLLVQIDQRKKNGNS